MPASMTRSERKNLRAGLGVFTPYPVVTLALALQNYQSQHGGVQWHHLMVIKG